MKKLYFLAICFSLVSSNLVAQETTEKQQLKKTTNGVSVADMDIRKLTWKAMNGSNTPPANLSKLDTYFRRYCNCTGSLGLGFVASHTCDFKFRQQLKKTTDPDLKRLFVLQHLYREMDIAVSDYKEGVVVAGKGMKRNMTPEEKEATRKKLIEKIKDLELFDPKDPEREIAQHREALK